MARTFSVSPISRRCRGRPIIIRAASTWCLPATSSAFQISKYIWWTPKANASPSASRTPMASMGFPFSLPTEISLCGPQTARRTKCRNSSSPVGITPPRWPRWARHPNVPLLKSVDAISLKPVATKKPSSWRQPFRRRTSKSKLKLLPPMHSKVATPVPRAFARRASTSLVG